MADNDLATTVGSAGSDPSGGKGAEGGDAGTGDLKGENTRLRQRLAQLEQRNTDAVPYVNAVVALSKTKVGAQIMERIQNGEDLTEYQLSRVEKALATETPPPGITEEQLREALKTERGETMNAFADKLRTMRMAEKSNAALEAKAEKELPGYEKLRGTPVWKGAMDAVIGAIRNGTIPVPEGQDPFWIATNRAYHLCVSEDPDIAKGPKPSAPKSEERLKELLASATKPSASKIADAEKDMPESYKRQLELARSLGSGTVGKSFGNPSATKKKAE